MSPLERVRQALEERGMRFEKGRGGRMKCQCPAHEDAKASMSLWEASDGAACVKCFAGCSTDQVMAALGMTAADLFPEKERKGRKRKRAEGSAGGRSSPRTSLQEREPAASAEARAWPLADLAAEVARAKKAKEEAPKVKRRTRVYTYLDAEGRALHCQKRTEPGKKFSQYRLSANGRKVWGYGAGWYRYADGQYLPEEGATDPDVCPGADVDWFPLCVKALYRLPSVLKAKEEGRRIWLVEGEEDAEAVAGRGECSTCNVGGAGKWEPQYAETLAGADVAVVIDQDEAGYRHAALVGRELAGKAKRLAFYRAAKGKDADDHLRAGLAMEDLVEVPVELVLALAERWKEAGDYVPPAEPLEGGGGVPGEPGGGDGAAAGHRRWEWTELGAAKRLIHQEEGDVRYCPQFGEWLVWGGSRWVIDETAGAPMLARFDRMRGEMLDEAEEIKDEGEADGYRKWCKQLGSRIKVDSVVDLARRLPGVPVHQDELDGKGDLLPVANGVVDLRTGELVAGARDHLFTKGLRTAYNPDTDCPLWMAHLEHVTGGDPDYKRYLWLVCGYALTGSVQEQKAFFLYGNGGTGKSMFVETMQSLLGEFAYTLDPSKVMLRRSEDEVPTHFASLAGRRFVSVPEVKQGDHFDEGLIKRLTGDDRVATRYMRKDIFLMTPRFKMFFTGNHKPYVSGQDEGIWRRLHLLPFVHEVRHRDQLLKEKLKLEYEGILAWAVAGCRAWYEQGLTLPKAVAQTTQEYREDMDVLGKFIRDMCVVESWRKTGVRALYTAFKRWQKEIGEFAWSERRFGMELKGNAQRFGVSYVDQRDGRFYEGLGLADDLGVGDVS